jgi:4-hydroxy-tetrahydrodipicolinate reductase
MGRLIQALAGEHGVDVAAVVTRESPLPRLNPPPPLDVAFEFTNAGTFLENLDALCALGVPLIVGTTGWAADEGRVRAAIDRAGIGAVVAANFSVGASVLEAVAAEAASLLQAHPDFGAFVHEAHHAAKKDAPSGTAKMMVRAMTSAGYDRAIDVAATRAGHIPGVHTVGFDGPSETLAFTHTVRNRATFARGALHAAHWVQGKRGWFTMKDVLGLGSTQMKGGRTQI